MKVTLNWLREYIDFDWDAAELENRLTMSGLESESLDDLGERYRGVVVGRVMARSRHPRADRLSVCQVDVGEADRATIVCGAPNVAPGQKVAVILPGHSLPNGTGIERTRIRGVESEGMICSEAELDLGTDADGILVLPADCGVGTPFAEATGLDDVVVEFEVTPNRPDCLSVVGIAREIRALTGAELRRPEEEPAASGESGSASASVEIEDAAGCPRYVCRVVRGVGIGPSPVWMQRRLQAVGMRPVNNVVDVTNFAMLELGQPLHAFDLATIPDGSVVVRRARVGERLRLLDDRDCDLDESILVIADCRRPIALAGIMGGAETEVTGRTTDILLESAYFSPETVRAGARRLGVSTEASARFERGTDWELPPLASDRAAGLLAELTGGTVAPGRIDAYPSPLQRPRVPLRTERVNALLSTRLRARDCKRILELLGCEVEPRDETLQVTVPGFRPDLRREVDLVEEVGRIYGFDRIEASSSLRGPLENTVVSDFEIQQGFRQRMTAAGVDEVVTSTIVDGGWTSWNRLPSAPALANPATSSDVLRSSLIPSLADVARRNFNRRTRTVCIFEIGKCFLDGDAQATALHTENLRLGGLWFGLGKESSWRDERRQVDFLDLKGLIESVTEDLDPGIHSGAHPLMRVGHCAELSISGKPAGNLGECSRELREAFDLPEPVYIFELEFEVLATAWKAREAAFRPPPKFPPIERDLAIVLDESVPAGEVIAAVRQVDPKLIEFVELFDVYTGDQVGPGEKSLAFNLRLRSPERTLQDREADEVIAGVLADLGRAFGVRLR